MDKSEHLQFSSREEAQINEFANEVKKDKLKYLFLELLKHNELDYILQLTENKIPFFEQLNAIPILKEIIEDISNSFYKCEDAIENIKKINDERYDFIKELFIEKVVNNIIEISTNQMTAAVIESSPFHRDTLKLGQELLLNNPKYVNKFKYITLEEFQILVKTIELDNNLTNKNTTIKKMKV